jgi:hypothetical protein
VCNDPVTKVNADEMEVWWPLNLMQQKGKKKGNIAEASVEITQEPRFRSRSSKRIQRTEKN